MSEIFWEGLRRFLRVREHLLIGELDGTFVAQRAQKYATTINEKCPALDRCVAFMDGTVIGIARPGKNDEQNAAYNGHKRKHALKYQTLTTPDGLILHAHGPIAGCRHDWALYVRSNIEQQLREVLSVGGCQYYVHGDSGYNRRDVVDVPFQGAHLSGAQLAANRTTSSVRVTVEWSYKDVKLYWTVVDYKRKMRAGESAVGLLYIGAMLMHNIRNCLYPGTVSQYFKCSPPSLEEYLYHKE